MATALTNISNNLKKLFQTLLSYPFSITLTIIIFFAVVFLTGVSHWGFNGIANNISADLRKADSIRDSLVLAHADKSSYTKALANQYRYINQYKRQHYRVARTFEVYYYALVLVLALASLVATLIGVIIARTGWENQSPRIKAAFAGFFFCASVTAVLINVFNSSENAANNISKYFYFNNLQTNIYEGLAIDSVYNPKKRDSLLYDLFISTNKNIKENMNLFLNIKAEKIPATPDLNKLSGSQGSK